MKKILTFDFARRTGWCFGCPGEEPRFGSIRFASAGASHEAIFGHAINWAQAMFTELAPDQYVYEEPMQFRGGKSRAGNDEIAYGLPAIIQGVAHNLGIHDARKARVQDVRLHFIHRNPKREIAKRETMQRCRLFGWEVRDDNEADACALWHYACTSQDSKLAIQTSDLFLPRTAGSMP
ncbi:hypothetical protein [Bradyrhizobium paxllaeri]|uniref:hypothetical protein n=1 Tax=Bradyrhizobium paxllaeri TaxID=190148 RepID=UPI0008109FAE|nr:hypothetical protein [Bradyrhizobium paxllaeri]